MSTLDCNLIKPLKEYWKQECHKFYCKNTGKVISKINFNGIFRKAWLNAITPANVAAGFRKASVYPFNQNAISCPEISDSQEDEISEIEGIYTY